MVIILLYILYFLGFATGIDEPSTSTVTDARSTLPMHRVRLRHRQGL